VISVNTGRGRQARYAGRIGRTAIDKRPHSGPVAIRRLGADDGQSQFRPASVDQRPGSFREMQCRIDIRVVVHAAHVEHIALLIALGVVGEELAIDAVADDFDAGAGHTRLQHFLFAVAADGVSVAEPQQIVFDAARELRGPAGIDGPQRIGIVVRVAGQDLGLDIVPIENEARARGDLADVLRIGDQMHALDLDDVEALLAQNGIQRRNDVLRGVVQDIERRWADQPAQNINRTVTGVAA